MTTENPRCTARRIDRSHGMNARCELDYGHAGQHTATIGHGHVEHWDGDTFDTTPADYEQSTGCVGGRTGHVVSNTSHVEGATVGALLEALWSVARTAKELIETDNVHQAIAMNARLRKQLKDVGL